MTAHGHCLCGNIEFEANGTPSWVAYCHCASCRRHTGSPVACFVNFARGDVVFRREPSVFESSPGVRRSFCDRCGTPIAYETEKRANEIDIYLNVFDEPEAFSPETHVFHSERIPWFDTRDELQRKG
ncbi:MAG TPA: GFA family protein [Gammaproteobacteria bacterium]|nr:GFA family protein [Gammaproteobacteria bacterium]